MLSGAGPERRLQLQGGGRHAPLITAAAGISRSYTYTDTLALYALYLNHSARLYIARRPVLPHRS